MSTTLHRLRVLRDKLDRESALHMPVLDLHIRLPRLRLHPCPTPRRHPIRTSANMLHVNNHEKDDVSKRCIFVIPEMQRGRNDW
jgi:hypothetical protein